MLRITQENPHDAVCATLMAELTADIEARYGAYGDGDFQPDNVLVPRAAFVVAWWGEEAVGCGAIRPMQAQHIGEVKRMYTRPTMRSKGIARQILARLKALARDFGYDVLQLQTGILQPEAIRLYESAGYHRIPCFGQYEGDELSVCFEKEIDRGA